MFYQLPPVGDPITWPESESRDESLEELFLPYRARFYDSGTSALAAAIRAAAIAGEVERPEVIIPAYGCPDLVAAAVHAGAKPVLADLEPGRPWLDPAEVENRITGNTVAIVAVDLFGIPERFGELRAIAEKQGLTLIEDSAQSFPVREKGDFWSGDLVVLSFGRGKPVSLLGGGAVLFRGEEPGDRLPATPGGSETGIGNRVTFRLKAALYNRLIDPHWYWLPQSLPFLHLGETRYHPLHVIRSMDPLRMSLLPCNAAAYHDAGLETQRAVAAVVAETRLAARDLADLPRICGVEAGRRMLRYPLLAGVGLRNRLLRELHRRGLGPSVMYPEALPRIEGLQPIIGAQGPFPAAEDFARRVLTLPVHRQLRSRDIAGLRSVFQSFDWHATGQQP